MNETPSAERVHIGFFGRRNAGKSSLMNAVTGQQLSIVSPVEGTTTDPVYKTMELLPAGPVMLIDTPGLDDHGELGQLRIERSIQAMRKSDIAVVVIDASVGLQSEDETLIKRLEQQNIPYLMAWNKIDFQEAFPVAKEAIPVSTVTGQGIQELKDQIADLAKEKENGKRLAADLVQPLDLVVLVVPIDKSAPKGRLILPQQQVIRDLLEAGAIPVVCRDSELKDVLRKMEGKVKLVITDSQVFGPVSRIVPEEIYLTSFSILFARYKSDLAVLVEGARTLDKLQPGDRILISEGCTHHRQCEDIGTVKLPRLVEKFSRVHPEYAFSSGRDFPEDLSSYRLAIHCGGCMLNEKEMAWRLKNIRRHDLPVTNYGVAIAYMNGILERSLRVFPAVHALLVN